MQEAAEARKKVQMEECRSSMQRLATQIAEAESPASPQAARPCVLYSLEICHTLVHNC